MTLNKEVIFATIFVALIALLPLPIGFYSFVRIVICASSTYLAIYLFNKNQNIWMFSTALAIIYNPFIPVYLDSKELWSIINITTAAFFYFAYSLVNNEK